MEVKAHIDTCFTLMSGCLIQDTYVRVAQASPQLAPGTNMVCFAFVHNDVNQDLYNER
jgi:hypothetical protein